MKLLTVCLTLILVITGSTARPQGTNQVSSDSGVNQVSDQGEGQLGQDQLPDDSYFPRDAAGNVVLPDPSRPHFPGSDEAFQVPASQSQDPSPNIKRPNFTGGRNLTR